MDILNEHTLCIIPGTRSQPEASCSEMLVSSAIWLGLSSSSGSHSTANHEIEKEDVKHSSTRLATVMCATCSLHNDQLSGEHLYHQKQGPFDLPRQQGATKV